MEGTEVLSVKNLSYQREKNKILDNISFSIFSNEITSIIGYNGSGKSTLLRLLVGSIKPSKGEILQKPNSRIGYVPQKLSFENGLPITVSDFIQIFNNQGHKRPNISCSFFSIKELQNKKISSLSGGQLQKVLIYNALLGDPNIVLLDEPTAGLDIQAQKEFYTLIEHIHKEHNISIVIVSHDIHSVYSKSNKVICLHQGKCCKSLPGQKNLHATSSLDEENFVVPYLHDHPQSDAR